MWSTLGGSNSHSEGRVQMCPPVADTLGAGGVRQRWTPNPYCFGILKLYANGIAYANIKIAMLRNAKQYFALVQ